MEEEIEKESPPANEEQTPPEENKELKEAQKKAEEYLEGWKRARAEFLNYKKEEMERIGALVRYANEEFILKLMPILDSFDIAQKHVPEELREDKNIAGFLKIKEQLLALLKNDGLEIIDCMGKKFDPNFHETAGEVEAEGKESGIVVEEISKGYVLCGKVLRPSKVRITK
jgi:molecular chaperone GrpE